MAVTTSYKKQEQTAQNTKPIQSSTPYQGLKGVSQNTANNLGNYQQGYKPSEQVTQAQQTLQQVQANKPQGYNSKYSGALESILQQIQSPQEFKYEFNGDNLFKAYADRYAQMGKQASLDAQGQAAALTGGYGNSYGAQVGQQTYNNYLTGLYDIGMDLRDRAYQNYRDNQSELANRYAILQGADTSDYNRFRDTISDWRTEEEQAYNRAAQAEDTDYAKYLNALNYYTGLAQTENAAYNTEAQLSEQARQHDTSLAEEQRQADLLENYRRDTLAEQIRQYDRGLEETQRQSALDEAYRRDTLEQNKYEFEQNYQLQVDQINEGIREFDLNHDLNNRKLMEDIRQYNTSLMEQMREFDKNYELSNKQLDEKIREFDKEFEQNDRKLAEMIREFDINNDLENRKLAESIRQANAALAAQERQMLLDEQYRRDALAQSESQFQRNLAAQAEQAALDEAYRRDALAQSQAQYDADNAYRYAALDWDQNKYNLQLDASQSSEDKEYNYKTAMYMLQNGQMPSDDLLAAAGISGADASSMITPLEPVVSYYPASTGNDEEKNTTGNGINIWEGLNDTSGSNKINTEAVLAAKKGINGSDSKIQKTKKKL
jgi:hypothetical protein